MPRVTASLRRQWADQRAQSIEERTHDQEGHPRPLEAIWEEDVNVALMDALLALPLGSHFDGPSIQSEVRAAMQASYPDVSTLHPRLLFPEATVAAVPEVGALVTVSYVDDTGQTGTFHGRMAEHYRALTVTDDTGKVRHQPYHDGTTTRHWVAVEHVIDDTRGPRGNWRGRDFEYDHTGLMVCLDSATATVAPIGDAGLAWLRERESPAEKRDRLLARFAALDPEASAELGDVIAELVQDAIDSERAASYGG